MTESTYHAAFLLLLMMGGFCGLLIVGELLLRLVNWFFGRCGADDCREWCPTPDCRQGRDCKPNSMRDWK